MEQEFLTWLLAQGPTVIVLALILWRNQKMTERLMRECMDKMFGGEH